jgi:hypothetical protein
MTDLAGLFVYKIASARLLLITLYHLIGSRVETRRCFQLYLSSYGSQLDSTAVQPPPTSEVDPMPFAGRNCRTTASASSVSRTSVT